LFAPVVPFITEEVWSWKLRDETGMTSIHRAPWPSLTDFDGIAPPSSERLLDLTIAAITAVRKFKADAKVSVMAALESLEFVVHPDSEPALRSVRGDLAASSKVEQARIITDASLNSGSVNVNAVLAPKQE
jgi:valyl-tRNA synthetase